MQEPTVLYEDSSLIAVNKPSGFSVHEDGVHDYKTLTEWLIQKYPDIKGVGEVQTLANGTVIERPGIVHRIDRETSGVLLVARTQEAYDLLKAQFAERDVRKVYRAFVYGPIKEDRGVIDKPIGSSRGGAAPRAVRNTRGLLREAVTAFRVVARGEGGEATYIEAFPKTGRTHQIRVHMASIQRPLICDSLYAKSRPPLLGFTRLALHAFSVTIEHPTTGKEVTFTAPLPEDFLAAEKLL